MAHQNVIQRISGFTLLELLTVIAVLGILFTITFSVGLRQIRTSNLNAAKGQLIETIEQLRSSAIRSSRPAAIEFRQDGGTSQYRTSFSRNGTAPTPLADNTFVNVPYNVQVTVTGGNPINYSAPYGEMDALDRTITLTLGDQTTEFYVVGVTGKVIQ